ncbi:MAG TPA: hypothetical protein PKE12_00370 [Kiritimatiellia bacterium]|nr:hypothetical protein [Kiritimatiellia bacterium]
MKRWLPLALLAVVWLGLGTLDWVMRLHWFQWHRGFIARPAKPHFMGDRVPLSTQVVSAVSGGDLSRLIGISAVQSQYAHPRPGSYALVSDEFGFLNQPPTMDRAYPVVLTGDSFLLQGAGMENLPGARVERLLEVPVYTIAYAGRGPAYAMTRALDHPNFRERHPRVLVWCVPERDATAHIFDSAAFDVMSFVYRADAAEHLRARRDGRRILWRNLAPDRLRASLPNTSILAQFMRRAWTHVAYALWGRISADVLIATAPVGDSTLLFYKQNELALRWPPAIRNVAGSVRAARHMNEDYFRPRGIHWVIALIPEKEQVYREVLPGALLPESALLELEAGLREANVPVVNLLHSFRAAALSGQLIFWPDDTHWNDAGMEIAARTLADELRPILADPGRKD